MLFEIVTLTGSVFTARNVKQQARSWLDGAVAGLVLGMWTTDVGRLGDLVILRTFDNEDALTAERDRVLRSDDAFGSASAGARLTMESYAPFPFLSDPKHRDYRGVFELQRPGGSDDQGGPFADAGGTWSGEPSDRCLGPRTGFADGGRKPM